MLMQTHVPCIPRTLPGMNRIPKKSIVSVREMMRSMEGNAKEHAGPFSGAPSRDAVDSAKSAKPQAGQR